MPTREHPAGVFPGTTGFGHGGSSLPSSFQPQSREVVVVRNDVDPLALNVRQRRAIDAWIPNLGRAGAIVCLWSFGGASALIVNDRLPSEAWLPEIPAEWVTPPVVEQTEVARQIATIQKITGWTDEELAGTFPAAVRETVNRWRNQKTVNLKPANLYRLGVLHTLAVTIGDAGIDAPVWLGQSLAGPTGETPYDLIRAGRAADVQAAVDAVTSGLADPRQPMQVPITAHAWDETVEDTDDDSDDWAWNGPAEEDA